MTGDIFFQHHNGAKVTAEKCAFEGILLRVWRLESTQKDAFQASLHIV